MWSLHVLSVPVAMLSGHSSFLTKSKNKHVSLTGDSKLAIGLNLRINVHLSLYFSSVMGSVSRMYPASLTPCDASWLRSAGWKSEYFICPINHPSILFFNIILHSLTRGFI